MAGTAKSMAPAIGNEVRVRFEGVYVDALVVDVKISYGQLRMQITPLLGSGEQWVDSNRILPMAAPAGG
jgi:hypothetical protein